MNNYCRYCINENDIIIQLDDIKIEDIEIKQLLNTINYNNKPFEESNINNTFTIIDKNNGICEVLSKEEENDFNKLINIIINDYKNYPNFSHFFNIKNLLIIFQIKLNKTFVKDNRKKV